MLLFNHSTTLPPFCHPLQLRITCNAKLHDLILLEIPFSWVRWLESFFCVYICRFGSFEIFKPTDPETGRAGPSVGRTDILTTMLDYTVENFYPEVRCSCEPSWHSCFHRKAIAAKLRGCGVLVLRSGCRTILGWNRTVGTEMEWVVWFVL